MLKKTKTTGISHKISTEKITTTPIENKVEIPKISKLELDFGRADLNQMRDKINEIIEKHNE